MWKWIVVIISVVLSYYITFEPQSSDLVQFRQLNESLAYDVFRYCTVKERLEYVIHFQFDFVKDAYASKYPHEETRQAFRYLKKTIIPRVMHCARRTNLASLPIVRAPLYEQLGPNITRYFVTQIRDSRLDYPYHLYPLYGQE